MASTKHGSNVYKVDLNLLCEPNFAIKALLGAISNSEGGLYVQYVSLVPYLLAPSHCEFVPYFCNCFRNIKAEAWFVISSVPLLVNPDGQTTHFTEMWRVKAKSGDNCERRGTDEIFLLTYTTNQRPSNLSAKAGRACYAAERKYTTTLLTKSTLNLTQQATLTCADWM